MMIHLEAGTCDSGIGLADINARAKSCYQAKHYTTGDDSYPYKCPECDNKFRYVSSLFQHVESDRCNQGYSGSIRKMRHWIAIAPRTKGA